jgi:hypothetical protein
MMLKLTCCVSMCVCIYVCVCVYLCVCVCVCVCVCIQGHDVALVCTYIMYIRYTHTAIPIIIERRFQVFQRFSSGKLVLKTVESCFAALNYYEIGSTLKNPCAQVRDPHACIPAHV